MSWAGRRRAVFVLIILLVAVVAIGLFLFLVLYDAPTCGDGIQNQDEQGLDCGGSCDTVCTELVSQPVVHWARSFEVVPGVYNSVAYIENPNLREGLKRISYTFKIFDSENILIAERKGATTLSADGVTPIFEGGIQTGKLIATRTFFEFDGNQIWSKISNFSRLISVNEYDFDDTNSPRLTATVSNETVDQFSDVEIVAILYDVSGNAFAASRTVISVLEPDGKKEIVFTWPVRFDSSVARIEILPIAQSD